MSSRIALITVARPIVCLVPSMIAILSFTSSPPTLALLLGTAGYDERVFSDNFSLAQGQNWTPFTGYFDLTMWLADEFREEVARRRAEQLGAHLNDFGLAFLDHCLRQTVFAPLCGEKVQQVLKRGNLLDSASLPSPFDQPRRRHTICIYLDGLAARKGLTLAQPPR